jgi:hypothetical protein
MDRAKKVSPLSRPASKANAAPKEQVNFEKAQGSSRHDEADLRDVARKAAKRSKERKELEFAPARLAPTVLVSFAREIKKAAC